MRKAGRSGDIRSENHSDVAVDWWGSVAGVDMRESVGIADCGLGKGRPCPAQGDAVGTGKASG